MRLLQSALLLMVLSGASSPALADPRDVLRDCQALLARADPRDVLRACQAVIHRAAQSAKDSSVAKPDEAEIERCRQVIRDWTLRESRMSVDEEGRPLR